MLLTYRGFTASSSSEVKDQLKDEKQGSTILVSSNKEVDVTIPWLIFKGFKVVRQKCIPVWQFGVVKE